MTVKFDNAVLYGHADLLGVNARVPTQFLLNIMLQICIILARHCGLRRRRLPRSSGAERRRAPAIGSAAAEAMPARTARRERIGVGKISAFDMIWSSCWGLEPGRKLALPLGLHF